MDSLFDFVKHQFKTALPGLLQNTTLHIYTASKRKTPPSANTSTENYIQVQTISPTGKFVGYPS